MAPHAHTGACERAAPRRVQPAAAAPAPRARAWLEPARSPPGPPEHRRLLAPTHSSRCKHKSRLQPGLTLGVWSTHRKSDKSTLDTKYEMPKTMTNQRTRREKIIDALRPPYFITSMILGMVCVQACSGAGAGGEGCAWRARLEWRPAGAWWREPWRLVTYGWVHASGAHVALNATVALAVGWLLEREQRWWRVAAVWAGGLAAGALGAGACQPRVRVVGASAAVYATLTAHLANVCLRFGHIPLWWFRPLSVAVLAASECSWALVRAPRDHRATHHVAWEAHMFGAAVGVPLALLVFTGENRSSRYVVCARAASALALAGGAALAALHYAPGLGGAGAGAASAAVRELTPDHVT